MLFPNRFGAVVLVVGGAVHALQFQAPQATPINKRFDPNGWTPIPTSKPKPLLELFKRQEDPAFCGYLEGDPESAVECDVGSSCMYDDVYSWFGCCTGTSITDCDVWTACVASKSIDQCLSHTECYDDPLITACSEAEYPYCATLVTEISGSSYGHFVCGISDTTYDVLPTAVDVSSFFFGTDTTEDFFTDTEEPSFTRFPSGTTTTDDSTTDEPTSTRRSPRSTTTTTDDSASSTEAPSSAPPATNSPANTPSSVSTAAAMRTAEVMLGAAGGLAGMLAYLL